MRTLFHMPEAKRERIALETMEIFAPLANRLGIWQLKWELEDLSFRYINPEQYKKIADKLNERRVDREKQIDEIIAPSEIPFKAIQYRFRDLRTSQTYLLHS